MNSSSGRRGEISQARAELQEAGEIAVSLGLVTVSKSEADLGAALSG